MSVELTMTDDWPFNVIYLYLSGCPEGWVYNNGLCYKLYIDPLPFDRAAQQCLSHGAKLLYITSQQENNFLSDWIINMYGGEDWNETIVSLSKLNESWRWPKAPELIAKIYTVLTQYSNNLRLIGTNDRLISL